jgi:hypothetical protein
MSEIVEEHSEENQEIAIPKHAGGRPKNIVWQYFDQTPTKHPGHFEAKCLFCDRYWKIGIVKKLQVHLACECENVDMDIKTKFMHIVASRDGLSSSTEINLLQPDTNNEESHTNKNDDLTAEQIAFIDRLILRTFIMCGIPFRVVENPYFINILKNLRLTYNPPSRERLSTNLLSEESIKIDINIGNLLEKESNLTLGINFLKLFIYLFIELINYLVFFILILIRIGWVDHP